MVGRLLKRRAGVRLGLLYQLFCLTLAFYAAIAFYGVQAGIRDHATAALILLGTFLVVALLNRYLWEGYIEKRRDADSDFGSRRAAPRVFLIATL